MLTRDALHECFAFFELVHKLHSKSSARCEYRPHIVLHPEEESHEIEIVADWFVATKEECTWRINLDKAVRFVKPFLNLL